MFITQKGKKKSCFASSERWQLIKVQETQGRCNLKQFSYLSIHRKSSLGTFMPCLLVEESNRSWQTCHCCSCMYSLTSKINSLIVSWIGNKWIEYCTLQVNCTYLRSSIFCFKRLYWLEQFVSIIIVQYQGVHNHIFVRSIIGGT